MTTIQIKSFFIAVIILGLITAECNPSAVLENTGTVTTIVTSASMLQLKGSFSNTQMKTVNQIISATPTISMTVTPLFTVTPIAIPHLIVAYPNYGEEGGLFIFNPPASPIKVGKNIYPPGKILITDDGTRIIYSSLSAVTGGLGYEIYAVKTDGSGNRILLTLAQIDNLESKAITNKVESTPYNLQLLPGTHRLLFSTGVYTSTQPFWMLNNNLFVLDVDTGVLSRIFVAGAGGSAWPSPDANKIAILQRQTAFLASINGITIYKDIVSFEHDSVPRTIVWAKDSSRFGMIVSYTDPYQFTYPSENIIPNDAEIWSVDVSTGIASLLETITNFGFGILSPTLDSIGFTRFGTDSITRETYVSTLDGSISLHLGTGPSGILSFSPDGRHFAFYIGKDSNPNNSCDGDKPQQKNYIGSLEGETILLRDAFLPHLFSWVNNSQFVYVTGTTIQLGDIGGHSIPIGTIPDCIHYFVAKDLDFKSR